MKRSALAKKEVLEFIDPVEVDSKHYSVDFENDYVRVVRIKYGPHEKSVMHDHPSGTAVFLTGQRSKFTFPDGSSEVVSASAGETRWMDAFRHLPENITGEGMELVYIEVKQA